jgi:hypothetical protein
MFFYLQVKLYFFSNFNYFLLILVRFARGMVGAASKQVREAHAAAKPYQAARRAAQV